MKQIPGGTCDVCGKSRKLHNGEKCAKERAQRSQHTKRGFAPSTLALHKDRYVNGTFDLRRITGEKK